MFQQCVSPALRHTFAVHYLNNGGSLIRLKQLLGHKHLTTTLLYLSFASIPLRLRSIPGLLGRVTRNVTSGINAEIIERLVSTIFALLMANEIPQIAFNEASDLDVEVMSFAELFDRLNLSKDHDPFAVHRIEFYLILIVQRHSYTHFVDFKSYNLVIGSALFVAKNQVHRFSKAFREAEGTCIIFNRLFMDKTYFLSDKHKLSRLFNYHIETPVIHPSEMGEDSFLNLADQLYNEYNFPNDFAKAEMLRTLLSIVLLKAERAKTAHRAYDTKPGWLETFLAFKDMLEKEYASTRSSRAYAAELFVSYKLLNDIVKGLTGKTVKAFIDDFVTTEIKRYLVSTALSVQEVSYKTGFEDPTNMVKFFKKNTNTTPHKFRQQK